MDTQIQKDLIAGMIKKGEALRQDEAIFLKIQGIDETIVKTEIARDENAKNLEIEKDTLKILKESKKKAVDGVSEKIMAKMNEILPMKNAVFNCEDGLIMGMKNGDSITQYNGLSGGELQTFNAALSNVLDANIIVIEAAELDNNRIAAVMEDLQDSEKQIIINTCHTPRVFPGGFKMVEL